MVGGGDTEVWEGGTVTGRSPVRQHQNMSGKDETHLLPPSFSSSWAPEQGP